jgi:hypothetical protein
MAPTPSVALAAAAFLSAAVAEASDYTHYAQLCLPGIGRDVGAAGPMSDCVATALLSTPAGWQSGGGAVVLRAVGSLPKLGRDPLVAALIEAHTAVLELHPGRLDPALGPAEDRDPDAPEPGVAVAFVRGLAALRRQVGAGSVVAIGYGEGARAALDAVAGTDPGRPAGGGHFAAAAALADGTARFVRSVGEPLPSVPLGVVCAAIAAAEERPRTGLGEACFHAMAGRGLTKAALHR